jgi:MFS family permease
MGVLPSRPALATAQIATCYAVALFHRTCGAVLVFPIAASLDVAPHALNGIAIVFFWVYALLQLPSGILADLLGSRRLAIAGCVAMGMGALAFGLSNDVWMAISARGLIAAGCAVIFVAMVRHVKANWPADRVATVTGRGIFAGNVGTIASSAPLALILLFVDWRTLSTVLGAMSLALALGLWVFAAEAAEPHVGRARLRMVLPQVRHVLTNRSNHLALVVLGGLAGSYWAFVSLWALPLLVSKGMATDTAFWNVSATMACYAIGAPLFGWIADRSKRHGITLSIACAGAFACWLLLACDVALTPVALGLVLFALGLFCSAFHLVFAVVTERNPIEHAGTATAYVNIGTFGGAALMQSAAMVLTADGDYVAGVLPMASGAFIALVVSLTLWPAREPRLAMARGRGAFEGGRPFR